jgi:4-coumarate--CoA ligase (photoactive yellow protein activation family)
MLPAVLGLEVLDARYRAPAALLNQIYAGDLLVATPSTWQHLCDHLVQFPKSAMAVTSGAPCLPDLFHDLQARGLAVTEIYGSSETAGVGSRNSPEQPFDLLSFWRRGSSPLNIRRFSPSNQEVREFELPDRLAWCDDCHFFVSGRKDSAVQILGTNVFPDRIAEVIRNHPCVEDCAVRLMRPAEGNRLKAFVVIHAQQQSTMHADDLANWLRQHLQPHERPTSIVIGTSLPRNEMGKLADWDCPC